MGFIFDQTVGAGLTGVSNIAASESRTNVAYGTLTTPDQVTGIVLPTNGLIAVGYQATWQESVVGAARAAIFIGANQLKTAMAGFAAPVITAAMTGGNESANAGAVLASCSIGLFGISSAGINYTGDVSTGQVLGCTAAVAGASGAVELNGSTSFFAYPAQTPEAIIFATAGTYTVSVRFKSSSGTVTASNRKLWVEAKAF